MAEPPIGTGIVTYMGHFFMRCSCKSTRLGDGTCTPPHGAKLLCTHEIGFVNLLCLFHTDSPCPVYMPHIDPNFNHPCLYGFHMPVPTADPPLLPDPPRLGARPLPGSSSGDGRPPFPAVQKFSEVGGSGGSGRAAVSRRLVGDVQQLPRSDWKSWTGPDFTGVVVTSGVWFTMCGRVMFGNS